MNEALLKRLYEVVHHDEGCPAIGGAGDTDCTCDAVPVLRECERLAGEDGPEERLELCRAIFAVVIACPRNAVPLAKAGLDFCDLTAAQRAEMGGD